MEDGVTNRISVEVANNGFCVYVNEWFISGQVSKQSPYVFETMENLLEFIKTKLKDKNEFNLR
jgi:hypothetical protein